MGLFNWLSSLFKNNTKSSYSVSFPNTITKEEYYRRKTEKENKALSNTQFWNKLEVDIFTKNIE